jgi:HK97 family phage portal protein
VKWPWSKKTETREADPSWGALIDRGALSDSGAYVDARSAEGIATVYAAVNLIAGTVASLPLHVYRRLDNGDRERAQHRLADLLAARPNDMQTAFELREQLTAHCLLTGNAYAEVLTDRAGEVTELRALNPHEVTVVKLPNGRHRYDVVQDGRVRALLALGAAPARPDR